MSGKSYRKFETRLPTQIGTCSFPFPSNFIFCLNSFRHNINPHAVQSQVCPFYGVCAHCHAHISLGMMLPIKGLYTHIPGLRHHSTPSTGGQDHTSTTTTHTTHPHVQSPDPCLHHQSHRSLHCPLTTRQQKRPAPLLCGCQPDTISI